MTQATTERPKKGTLSLPKKQTPERQERPQRTVKTCASKRRFYFAGDDAK